MLAPLLLLSSKTPSCNQIRLDPASVNLFPAQRIMAAALFFLWNLGRMCHTMVRKRISPLEIAFAWAACRSGADGQKLAEAGSLRGQKGSVARFCEPP
ncbi:MAG: hypothetical protein MUP25_00040, partial [Syntrophales bacterium]|nr:hypothetical protein [Syntrophales bacterium]